ncbi:MAG: hypothetical protein QNJ51_22785 [Calothrix sp. MO_167.B12]|nr:hypothetical protein [Calothrix sp. MO_167.B12]
MSANERSRRILEHLKKTSNVKMKFTSPRLKLSEPAPVKETPAPPPPPTPTTPKKPENRKKQVMEHLTRSGTNFDLSSASSGRRKQRIQEHIRRSIN